MAKSVLISIQPEWCELIASGKKTLEVRKNRPKLETPFKCYIYCTKDGFKSIFQSKPFLSHNRNICNGKVIGEFTCDRIDCFDVPYPAFQKELDKHILDESCCTYYQLHRYAYHDALYGWHISGLAICDKPKELNEFYKCGTLSADDFVCQIYDGNGNPRRSSYASYLSTQQIRRAPQSWCYVEELKGGAK
ncbi:MAG: hypothetical protein SO072_01725 [Dysosmobacter sp.]|nr:hypothetical protein [Dysosmobacter sp.]